MDFKSLKTHLRYSIGPVRRKLEKPTVIQFPVIDICNSRCQMCRIWENEKSVDISVQQLKKGLQSELFSEVTSIGFNGGEPTLRADLSELVRTVIDCLPNLKNISLITNAYKSKQVVAQIEAIGDIVADTSIHFDVMVSLDGYGDKHDRVRGRPGNFLKAKTVISFLKECDYVDNIRIGCTVIKENVYDLVNLFEFCLEYGVYIKYRIGIPHKRLYTENLLDPYALSFEEKYELVEFLEGIITHYEQSDDQKYFYRSLIDQLIRQQPRKAGCDWKHRGATITAQGELAFCAVHSPTIMSDISVGDPQSAFFSAEKDLEMIVETKCDDCTHDYVGLPSPADYRGRLSSKLSNLVKLKLKFLTDYNAVRSINTYRHAATYERKVKTLCDAPKQLTIRVTENSVLICGWYGTETLGDKAILGGVLETLRKFCDKDTVFYLASLNPYISKMTKLQMPEMRDVQIVSVEEAIGIAGEVRVVAFGGGPMMAIESLAPIQAIFRTARANSVLTVLAGVGVGPFGLEWHNRGIKDLLELSDVRVFRDKRSFENVASLGFDTSHDFIAEDPAFTWLTAQNVKPIADRNLDKKVILLGLRDFPYEEYAKHLPLSKALSIKANYENVVLAVLERIVQQQDNVIIRPLPMCTNHFGGDDRWFYRKLLRENTNLSECLDSSLLGRELPPKEYLDSFSQADILVGMRFHSLVFGIALGTRCLALDYTLGKGKVRSLAEKHNITCLGLSELNADELFRQIMQVLEGPRQTALRSEDLSFSSTLVNALTGRV